MTPLTDAAVRESNDGTEYVEPAFARSLELRVAELTALLREARAYAAHANHLLMLMDGDNAAVSTLLARIDSSLEGK